MVIVNHALILKNSKVGKPSHRYNNMPYKIEGKKVMHQKAGKWSVKQVATSHKNAKETVNLLRGIEHGWKPTGKKK